MSDSDAKKAKQSPPWIVPRWVFEQGFNIYQIAVMSYIVQRDCGNGCWENKKTIARTLGIKPGTLKRTLDELLEHGWLKKTTKKTNKDLRNSHCYNLAGDRGQMPPRGKPFAKQNSGIIERINGKRMAEINPAQVGAQSQQPDNSEEETVSFYSLRRGENCGQELGPKEDSAVGDESGPDGEPRLVPDGDSTLGPSEEPTLGPDEEPKLATQLIKRSSQINKGQEAVNKQHLSERILEENERQGRERAGLAGNQNAPKTRDDAPGRTFAHSLAEGKGAHKKGRPPSENPHQKGTGDWVAWMLENGHASFAFLEGFSHMQVKPGLPKPPSEKWGASDFQIEQFAKAVAQYNRTYKTNYTPKKLNRNIFVN